MSEQARDTWALSQGEMSGKPIFVRFREHVVGTDIAKGYQFQIGVATPLLNPTVEGLTNDKESEELNVIEDELERALGRNQAALHVMTITYNGMRECVFYAMEWKPQHFEELVKEVARKVAGAHKLQFMMQQDKEWETYR